MRSLPLSELITMFNPTLNIFQPSLFATLFVLATPCVTFAQTATPPAKAEQSESPWAVGAGLGISTAPEYEGGKKKVSGFSPLINLTYKTKDWGTIGIDQRTRGLAWTFLETDNYSAGISIGANPGRTDSADGTLFNPGSKRLAGLGKIKQSGEFSIFGEYVIGIPLRVQVTRGLGNGKLDLTTNAVSGSNGMQIEIGTQIPYQVTQDFTLFAAPAITWADTKYTQTFFGVTNAQAARSQFFEQRSFLFS